MHVSIRQKIILFTVVPITLIYVVIFGFGLNQGQQRATIDTEKRLTQMAGHYASKVDAHMRELAQIARSTANFLENDPDQTPQELYELLRTNVRQSPAVYGAAVAFVPGSYPDKSLFAPYAYRDENRVETLDIAKSHYDYTDGNREWWDTPQKSWQGIWTAPYLDATPSDSGITTYATPFYRNGRFRGVTTVDLKLDTIVSLLPISQEPGLNFIILTRKGDLVYTPARAAVGHNLLKIAVQENSGELLRLVESILSGEPGITKTRRMTIDGETQWISYAPVESSEWALAAYLPESVALAGVRREAAIEAALLLLSLILIIISVWVVSGLISQPITQLQNAVRKITKGELKTELAIQSKDEIGVLARSFTRMSRQLIAREEALRQARENNLGRLVEGMQGNYFYYVMDQVEKITYVSPSVEDTLGLSPDDFIKQHRQLLNNEEYNPLFGNYARRVLAGEALDPVELRVNRADGKTRFIEIYAVAVEDSKGSINGLEAIARDITRAKQTEQNVIRARDEAEAANHAKSQFLANMSHELRTPLNGVLGYAQILLRERGHNPQQTQSLRAIEDCGQHLLSLINDILDLAKIEGGDLVVVTKPIHLRRVIDSVYQMVSQRVDSKGLLFVLEIDSLLPASIHSDSVKLKQILLNLLANAIKFTRKGTIEMSVRLHDENRIRFAVKDTGAGIAPEMQKMIFTPFGQTEEGRELGGTGLGLTISRRLVKALGGELSLNSREGAGSEFHFNLPLIAATNTETIAALPSPWPDLKDPQLPRGQQITILVADDQHVNRDVLVRLLEGAGFHTRQAKDGQQALKILRETAIPLVLMDIRMPVMSGVEAIAAIRQDAVLKHTKVIAVTASIFPDTSQHMERYECDDLISKPFKSDELFYKIAQQLQIKYRQSHRVDSPQLELDRHQELAEAPRRELAKALSNALEMGDIVLVHQLADKLRSQHPEAEQLANQIEQLARNFDFDNLENLSASL